MGEQISFAELVKRVDEVFGRIEAVSKRVDDVVAKMTLIPTFKPEEAKVIALQFSGVLKAFADAVSKLAEQNIGYESKFDSVHGVFTVQLYKMTEPEVTAAENKAKQ